MKKNILAILFCIVFSQINAQTNLSCSSVEYCTENPKTQVHDKCNEVNQKSLFKINKDETIITHITEDLKSIYYVKTKEYDAELKFFTYVVNAEEGSEFEIIVSKSLIIVQAPEKRNELTKFHIQKIWFD